MNDVILSLRGFGVGFGERIVLSSVNLDVPDRQVVVLLGPGGTGKSTLLRTLAGFNAANPSLRSWGAATYAGEALGSGERPALVSQSARLMMASILDNVVQDLPERQTLTRLQQRDLAMRLLAGAGLSDLAERLDEPVVRLPLALQRHLAILRLAAAGPRLLCVDEPTTGLGDAEAERILQYLVCESAHRSLLVVLHNQEQARRLGGCTALLAGGLVQEMQPTADFFSAPRTAAARAFVRNGNCAVPSPGAEPDNLEPLVEPPPPVPQTARECLSDAFGPRGFLWLKHGELAGAPLPGVFLDINYDLKALRRVGVTHLISLTRTPLDAEALAANGLRSYWSPIPDMGAPSVAQAIELCQHIDRLVSGREVVAVHCRAGLGRTGTVLAAYLIWKGATALGALETARRVEPRWVQSDEQVAFLEEFAVNIANRRPAPRAAAPDASV
jgi:atypical dual specificity phosphatase